MTTAMHGEASISLPWVGMFSIAAAIPSVIGGAWWAVATFLRDAPAAGVAGLSGAAVVAVTAVISTLIITPWKTRPVGLWMTIWLAGTTVRLLLAPALTFLLYSATPLDATALGLSVGVTYLATLLGEAGLLASYLNRMLSSHVASDVPE